MLWVWALSIWDQANLTANYAKLFHHGRNHLVHALHAGELVGVRKQVTFKTFRIRSDVGNHGSVRGDGFEEIIARTQTRSLYGLRDLEHVVAFRNYDSVEINVAVRQALMNINCPRTLIEKVLSGFKRTSVMKVVPQNESVGVANDSCGLQFGRDASSGISGMQQHKRLPRRSDRLK